LTTVFLKPQNSIFQRLAKTGPKSNSKAQMGISFDYRFLKTPEQHFPTARYNGAEELGHL